MATFIAGVSPDIPWHVTAFHGDYKMTETDSTTADMLAAAAGIGREAGLRHIYAGNLPGQVGALEDTRCASCGETLVARYGYHIRDYRITPDGRCPSCSTLVPGRWNPQFDGQIASRPFAPGSRSRLSLLHLS
jgi:pyruvate formate lyase activating enzyme